METPTSLMNEPEKPEPEYSPIEETPLPLKPTAYADPATVIVIPRVLVNYVIIGIVFFALGAIIAGAATSALFNANSAENQALIQRVLDARGPAAAAQPGLTPGQHYDVSADDDPSIGSPDAPITIVEFSDFHCPYCSRFEHETLHPLLNDYAGKVRLVYRDLPILGQGSLWAALAAECMNDQNKFWEFHDLLFDNQQDLTREAFIKYAQQLNVNVEQFTTCYDQQQKMAEVSKDASDAQALGVSGTPAFFVNGTFISGAQPYALFASTINEELGKLSESTPEPVTSSS